MEFPYFFSAKEVTERLQVDPAVGLDDAEVASRRVRFGSNVLPRAESIPLWKLVLKQFEDLLVKILLAAALISFVLALFEDSEDQLTAFMEPVVIGLILVANAIVGVIQETNADKAIEALKEYTPERSSVLRNGHVIEIASADLVPGDIVEVRVGNKVPADIRLTGIFSAILKAEHSALTGESNTVLRNMEPIQRKENERAVIQDQTCMLFLGTSITLGHARGVVTSIGESTEFGKINRDVQKEDEKDSPLEKTLNDFGKLLSWIILIICILVWIVNIGNFNDPSHGGWVRGAIYYFKIAVALAVAAIPEGLPAVVTTCLALGAVKMAKRNAIVRSLPHVETLGCTTTIFSDKTGTLTSNQMSVSKVLVMDAIHRGDGSVCYEEYDVSGTTYSGLDGEITCRGGRVPVPADVRNLREVAMVSALCNDASLVYHDSTDSYGKVGESTEAALLALAEKVGVPVEMSLPPPLLSMSKSEALMAYNKIWRQKYEKLATLDFSRDRKSMSVLVRKHSSEDMSLLVKGAPENILERSTHVQLNDGNVVALTPEIRKTIDERVLGFSEGPFPLRCLAFAKLDQESQTPSMPPTLKSVHSLNGEDFAEVETGMTLLGVAGMLDPPRKGVDRALKVCKEAGIRVVVVTGDNKATAESIGKRIGMFGEFEDLSEKSFTGIQFENMSDQDRRSIAKTAQLVSRVEPQHKRELVSLFREVNGDIVAMTGDGTNDAPALKEADIGIAMGTGTEVAKESAAIVLADDNFSTIVAAVEEGRAIYANTKQFIRYLISSNIGEVACIFLTAVFGMPEALVPVQLLWVNFVTDGLPATALGFNKKDSDIMKNPPRSPTEPIVNGMMFMRYLIVGLYVGFATVGGFVFWFLMYEGGPQITWHALTHFHSCVETMEDGSGGASGLFALCSVFDSRVPSTIALSILVSVEMFNACNAVSENQSLLVMPLWSNLWLVGAISLSFVLHLILLYVPFFARIFSAASLSLGEWGIVLAFSLPVILLDEIMKFGARAMARREAVKRIRGGGGTSTRQDYNLERVDKEL